MPQGNPYLTTCRGCGKQNIQFGQNADYLVAYCSPECRKLVKNHTDQYPVREPQLLEFDEYAKIAFTVKVLDTTAAKPTPPKQAAAAKPRYTKRPSKAETLDFRCPTKFKRQYRNQQEAWAFIRETFPDDKSIRPYTCTCGAIHIGHSGK